jgi:hypothetical protein
VTEPATKDVLHGIEELDWAALRHAYGPATDVPQLLRALTSDDKSERKSAWYELYGNLWHQGSIYEATFYVVPFLIKLLRVERVADKAEILVYLANLYSAHGFWQVHSKLNLPKPEKTELERRLKEEESNVEATRSAVRGGKRTYFSLLKREDLGTRLAAAYLLGLIGETKLEIVEEILKVAQSG